MPFITVFSASSQTGSACVKYLVKSLVRKHDVTVRAVFRTEDKANDFLAFCHGIASLEICYGFDAYQNVEKLAQAFEGADVAVLVTPHDASRGFSDDAKLMNTMIDAAQAAGVNHIVNIGSWTVHEPKDVSMIAARFLPAEEKLRKMSGKTTWTTLRSGFFDTNFVAMFGGQLKVGDTLRFPNQCSFAPVDPRDVGYVAATVAACGGVGHEGKTYEVSGPKAMTSDAIIKAFANALGRPGITLESVPASEFGGANFPPPLRELMLYLEQRGECAVPFSRDVETVTGVPAMSLEAWLREHKKLFQ